MGNERGIKLDYQAIGKILKSSEVSREILRISDRISQTANSYSDGGYSRSIYNAGRRYVGIVRTEDTAAAIDNLENNTMLKALHSAEGMAND